MTDMHAPHNLLKNTVLFLTLALLAIAPWHAQAQTFSQATDTVSVSSNGSQNRTIAGTLDPGTPLTFSAAISYQGGDQPWLSFNGSANCLTNAQTYITPVFVTFGTGCFAGQLSPNTTHTATVTLTATNNAQEVITVNYFSGGSGAQTLTPSASTVNINAAPGTIGFGSFTLSTTSGAAVSYNIANPTVNWLTFTQNQSGTVTSGNALVVGLEGNATGLTTSQSTSLTVTYNGSQTLTIQVNFNVGSGTGNGSLTFGQSNFNFSYNSGGSLPNAQSTTITNSSASTYTFSVNTQPSPWLAVDGQILSNGTTSGSTLIGTPITLQLDSNVTQLGTGSYTAIVTITDSNNNTGTITVGLSVNGGSTTQFIVSPNPVTLNAGFGSGIVQVNVSVTSNTSGTLTASITGAGLSLPVSSGTGGAIQTVTAGVPVTIIVQGNPSALTSNTYTGSLLLQENNATISQSYSVNFTVGSGPGNGSLSFGQTNFTFSYVANGNFPSTQQTTITNSSASIYTFSVNASPSTWLAVNGQVLANGATSSAVPISTPISLRMDSFAAQLGAGTYTATVTITDSTNRSGTLTITLAVRAAAPYTLTVSPNPITLSTPPGTTPAQVNVSVTSTLSGTLAASVTGTGLSIPLGGGSSQSIMAGVPVTVVIQGNPSGLAMGTYTGSLLLQISGSSLSPSYPLTFTVGAGGTATAGGNVVVASYTFGNQSASVSPFPVAVSSEGGFYRISAYFNTVSGSAGTACLLLHLKSDSGNDVSVQVLSDRLGNSCLTWPNGAAAIFGVAPVHVPPRTPLTIEVPVTGSGVFGAYVVVEQL